MITIYKDKKDIPQDMEYIELNDIFFNKNTVLKLDSRANEIVEQIDESELDGKYKIKSKFNGVTLEVLFGLKQGAVYSDYALIPFYINKVQVCNRIEYKVISDYEELKEWRSNEE